MTWFWPLVAGLLLALAALVPFARVRRLRWVFISYRRSDTASEARQIRERLEARFGPPRVFHDVRSIRPGENFRRVIRRTLRKCDAVLVLIGPDWTTCRDDRGALRLRQAGDMVRGEVAAALESGALVVPVLVRRDSPPAASELPEDLQRLVDLNAVPHEPQLTSTLASIAAAPVRRTPLMLLLSHLGVATFPFVFYLGAGMVSSEFTTTLAVVFPALAATAAVAVVHAIREGDPARVTQVRPAALFAPLGFVTLIAALVLFKAFNYYSFETFKVSLLLVESAFAAYTGIALASMFENRRSR